MKSQTVIWMLAICLMICFATLIVSVVYFLWQWKKLDHILELFQQGELYGNHGALKGDGDILETRESRVISQLWRILADAHFKASQAVGEKDQVMELISDLSHQLRTPLANIVMNIELLQDPLVGEDADRRKEFLAHTKSQADKMQWLMADLLKASKLENGIIRFKAGNQGVKGTIARALGSVYAQAAVKNIKLIVEEFQDFDLYHNPKWTAEAMSNILENAVKYSPKGSSIRITLTKLDIYTKIMITDEGIGIPEKEYNLIFKRFYRGREVEQQEGSGLGLYLAQLILQQEKGYITVTSRRGCGSSFSLFLLNKG